MKFDGYAMRREILCKTRIDVFSSIIGPKDFYDTIILACDHFVEILENGEDFVFLLH